MQKFKKYILILSLLFFNVFILKAQVAVPFTPRLAGNNLRIKGDIKVIGNSILNKTITLPTLNSSGEVTNLTTLTNEANNSYYGNEGNNGLNQEYIDIDSDPITFSSTSADLDIVNPCKKIIYAGLYWSATYPYERSTNSNSDTQGTPRNNDWNQMKFKVPGGSYIDIIADNNVDPLGEEDNIIFNGYVPFPETSFKNSPYVCYKNVTDLLKSLPESNGTYFGANIRASTGRKASGSASGWSLVIIYESPTSSFKSITLFDGYSNINVELQSVDFNVNGFTTTPAPQPVRAQIAICGLEGEKSLNGDNFMIKANSLNTFTNISNTLNPVNNFFNSSITNNDAAVTQRNPSSSNTLGFDLDVLSINNPSNSVLPNFETGATIRLSTTSDSYSVFLVVFSVDNVKPEILLTNRLTNSAGNLVDDSIVSLDEVIFYNVGFRNSSNVDITSLVIKSIIPNNLIFNPATDLTLPTGVTLQYYNPLTREIALDVPNNLVQINDPSYEIKMKVQVSNSCSSFKTACSNVIENQVFASYSGLGSSQAVVNQGSIADMVSCDVIPSPNKFTVNINNCSFESTANLCDTNSVTLTAANGYQSYNWSGPSGASIVSVSGTNNQSVIVNVEGNYTVNNVVDIPCQNIEETIIVSSSSPPSNSVTQTSTSLYTVETNANYQWVDCNNANTFINGAVNSVFEPVVSGSYAVIITNNSGCQVISNCIQFTNLGINELNLAKVNLYPNPVNDKLLIKGDLKIETLNIYNFLGQRVLSYEGNVKEYSTIELITGIYIVEIITEKGSAISRIIKN